MAEHPEEKQNSNGLFALCAGALIGVLNGIFIGWIIWGQGDVGRAAALAVSHTAANGRLYNVTDGGF